MDTATWITLIIALAAACGTLASAAVALAARHEAADAITIAREGTAATKRIADATEQRVQILQQQLEEEREKAKPRVLVTVLDAWVAAQGNGRADIRVRATLHNQAPSPDILQNLVVGFADTNYHLPPKAPPVRCFDVAGTQVRIPLHLESDRPIEISLEIAPAMGGRVEPGWESPITIESTFEHAPTSRVGALVHVPS